jgi:Ca2+-transporting ATPase
LDEFGRWLAILALAGAALVFVMGLLNGESVKLMFMTAISIAVAIVPEALPAIVTIALALGAQRMLKRHVLVRKLPAVETLGSVTVICSDKTGTLTQNRMTVTQLEAAGHSLDLTHSGHAENSTDSAYPQLEPALQLLLAGSALCNDALLESNGGDVETVGDPTEVALVIVAAEFGMQKADLERGFQRVAEIPFTSERKLMTTAHQLQIEHIPDHLEKHLFFNPFLADSPPPYMAFSKGAIDNLLEVSSQVWVEGRLEPLTEYWRERIQTVHEQLARNGMRGLGLAFKPLASLPNKERLEQELILWAWLV